MTRSLAKKKNGTGLGLAITLGIIQEHNGTISIETAPGCGTTFVIQLPTTLTRADTAPGPTPSQT